MKKWVICVSVLVVLGGCSQQPESKQFSNAVGVKRLDGSTTAAAEIDSTVTRLMSAAKVPGLGLAILNDGKLVYLKTYGFRNREKSLSLTQDSVMSGASFSKVAFAYMVMQLEGFTPYNQPQNLNRLAREEKDTT